MARNQNVPRIRIFGVDEADNFDSNIDDYDITDDVDGEHGDNNSDGDDDDDDDYYAAGGENYENDDDYYVIYEEDNNNRLDKIY